MAPGMAEIQGAAAPNFSPALQVVTWLLLALLSLVLFFRLLTRFFIKSDQSFGHDDLLILIAFVFSIGECVTEIIPAGSIYGRDINSLSPAQLQDGIKAGYARDILFLLSIGFAKLSVTMGLMALGPGRPVKRIIVTVASIVALWLLSSVLIAALQCGSQGPWDPEAKCIDRVAFWQSVSVVNIVSDVALVIIPAMIVYPLQMPLRLRGVIISFYSVRLLTVAPTVTQLLYTPRLSNENYTLDAFYYYLSLQLVQFTSLSSACVIYFWPFLRSLRSGLIFPNRKGLVLDYSLTKMRKLNSKDVSKAVSGSSMYMSATTGSRSDRDGSSNMNSCSSARRDRRDFIEITTDVSVVEAENAGDAQISTAEKYNMSWENSVP